MSKKQKPLEEQTTKQLGKKRHNAFIRRLRENGTAGSLRIFLSVASGYKVKITKTEAARMRRLWAAAKQRSRVEDQLESRINRILHKRESAASHNCPGCGHYHERKTNEGSH